MIAAFTILFVAAFPQNPVVAAAEAKARTDLAHAAKHIDDVLLHSQTVRDRAKAALELVRATEATAQQIDRARLAKLAADLAQQLTSLDATIQTHQESIRTLRLAIDIEIPPAEEGSMPWFRERMVAATKLPKYEQSAATLRTLETELQAPANKAKPGADALLGHLRYLLAEAIRGEADIARSKSSDTKAVGLLRDAIKKFEDVLRCADTADSGEGTSLHAAALRRRVEIEARLYIAFREVAPPTAKRHREAAEAAFVQLNKGYPDALLPSGERFVDVVRAAVDQMRVTSGR